MHDLSRRMEALTSEKRRLLENYLKNKGIEDPGALIARESQPLHQADQGIIRGEIGLLPIQKWFFNKNFPDKSHWNASLLLYSKENLDENAFLKAIRKIVAHHDALRIIYKFDGATIQQFNRGLDEGELFHYQVIDFTNDKDYPEQIKSKVKEINASINLTTGPLLKFGLFKTREGIHLLMVAHHLVADGVSVPIIINDLTSGYLQALNGRDIQLPAKTDSLMDWSKRIAKYANDPQLLQEIPYWKRIEETKVTPLPKEGRTDRNRIADSDTLRMTLLTAEETTDLFKVVSQPDRDIKTLLLAGLGLTVRDWTGESKVAVNMVAHGREKVIADLDITRTSGWFSIIYPVILDIGFSNELPQQIARIKETLSRIPSNGIGHGILKYITLPEFKQSLEFKLAPEISFNFDGQIEHRKNNDNAPSLYTLSPITASLGLGVTMTANTDREFTFEISLNVVNGELKIKWNYNKYEYQEKTVLNLIAGYAGNLRKITAYF